MELHPPYHLHATDVTDTQIKLAWRPASDSVDVQYVVFRDGLEISRRSETTFTDSSLTPDTVYRYFIASTDASGEFSVPSDVASVRTNGGGHAVPEWDSNSTSYEVGDAVLYRGNIYHCLQRHTSNVSWAPTAAVTLWKRA
ncbi:carbohydrate-binding protein [Streptomyces griseus]|uniref:carbohydrate-binding protein n=1 Tax=Streptomyces griseus TaxID=1911 RepID=UPI00379C2488